MSTRRFKVTLLTEKNLITHYTTVPVAGYIPEPLLIFNIYRQRLIADYH
jgi:hypothetical protein